MTILERLRSAESGSIDRVKRFVAEWRRCHPRNNDIYNLNVTSDREAALTVADLEALFTALEGNDQRSEK